MSDKLNLALSARDVAEGVGDMTRVERVERVLYEHGDGPLSVTLADLPVEDRRAFMAADTNPIAVTEPDEDAYWLRVSRMVSLAIVTACGVAGVVIAGAALVWGVSNSWP